MTAITIIIVAAEDAEPAADDTQTAGAAEGAEPAADAREVSCEGRQRFASYWQADGLAALLRERERKRGHPARISAYRCPRCDGFHIGTFAVKRVPLVTPPRWHWPASYDGGADTDTAADVETCRDEGQR